jgi:hypothetical protein
MEKFPELLKIVKSEKVLYPWAIERTTSLCNAELATLRTLPTLRGHANKLEFKTVRDFKVGSTSFQMKKHAPTLFRMVSGMLDIKTIRVHKEVYTDRDGVLNEAKKASVDLQHAERIQLVW